MVVSLRAVLEGKLTAARKRWLKKLVIFKPFSFFFGFHFKFGWRFCKAEPPSKNFWTRHWSLHWVMSTSKIAQCWQIFSKLTLDIGDLTNIIHYYINARLCATAARPSCAWELTPSCMSFLSLRKKQLVNAVPALALGEVLRQPA